jgi:hypothetical protein
MLEKYGALFTTAAIQLSESKWFWISMHLNVSFPDKQINRTGVEAITKVSLNSIRQACILAGMDDVLPDLDRLERLIWPPYEMMAKPEPHEIASSMVHFLSRLQDEIKSQYFFHLDQKDVPFYVGEGLVAEKFGWAIEDMSEAGKCLALQRSTACIFHLMRVLERAVQAFGKKLKVKIDVHAETWHQIMLHVNKEVQALPSKTAAQRKKKSGYAEAAAHLQSVRIAWRNEVMHPKQTYTRDEAYEVFNATKTFMAYLAGVL